MRSRVPCVCLVICMMVGVLSACTAAPSATATPTPGNGALEMLTIQSTALAGNLLGDRSKRSFFVYLPPDYARGDRRYPTVYVLHGFDVMATAYTDRVKAVEDQLAVSGPDNGLIIVFPDCTSQLGGCTYLSSPTIGDYESYIVREIVAQVDASYRTLATRNSRGVVGCSMGGDGAAHLALKYPQVFGAFASIAGTYDWTLDPNWEVGRQGFKVEPRSWDDLKRHGVEPLQVDMMAKWRIAEAAAASPNPDKPPFYLDMPFEIVDNQARIVPDVAAKIGLVDPLHDLAKYLQQPDRLRGMMLYHASDDPVVSVETSRSFDRTLTSDHIDHIYLEAEGSAHCDMDWTPVVQFMVDNLAR